MLEAAKPGDVSLLPAASALADYDPDNPHWERVGGKVAQALVTVNPSILRSLARRPAPVRGKLTPPLATIFRDKNRPETERSLATNILTDYASDDPDLIANLLMDADPKAYAAFFPSPSGMRRRPYRCSKRRSQRRQRYLTATRTQRRSRTDWRNVKLGQRSLCFAWGRQMRSCPCCATVPTPGCRSFIVNWLNPLGADPKLIAAELERIDPDAKPTPAQGNS